MREPPLVRVRRRDTHRLIPSRFVPDDDSVLRPLADGQEDLEAVFDLDNATNDRLRAEEGLLPGIGIDELVFGVPNARVVNAAFTHAHPEGSRFNDAERGAWYAAFSVRTAQEEVLFHKMVQYEEIGIFEDSVTYTDFLADFASPLHDLRDQEAFADCLDPDSYVASQALARSLLAVGSQGIVYPSVRHHGAPCIACFRPAAVGNVRRAATYRFTWSGERRPKIAVEAPAMATA